MNSKNEEEREAILKLADAVVAFGRFAKGEGNARPKAHDFLAWAADKLDDAQSELDEQRAARQPH